MSTYRLSPGPTSQHQVSLLLDTSITCKKSIKFEISKVSFNLSVRSEPRIPSHLAAVLGRSAIPSQRISHVGDPQAESATDVSAQLGSTGIPFLSLFPPAT